MSIPADEIYGGVGEILGTDAAVAVGRFKPDGVDGYRASSIPGGPIRATRVEAEADERSWRRGGRVPQRRGGSSMSEYSGVDIAAEWLDEHLKFTVSLRMHEIETQVMRMPPSATGLTYEDRVRNIGRRDFEAAGFNDYAASTIPALIATAGDALFGQSKPGRAGSLAAAMTTGLAAAALTQPGGVTFRGHHWCRAEIHHVTTVTCSCGYTKGECPTCALTA